MQTESVVRVRVGSEGVRLQSRLTLETRRGRLRRPAGRPASGA